MKEDLMSTDPTPERGKRPAKPEQPHDAGFAEGESHPETYPEDERVGRFSAGEEQLPDDDPEKQHHGRFSEGQEELPEEDPEKHVERRFSEGQDHEPPDVTP
jgi:hypothetical protein